MSNYEPLNTTRTFNAPIQAVWDAWTQPDQFKQWYMPAPFSIPSCEFDLRKGGLLRIDTQSPEGVIMSLIGEFKVVDEPSTLVMTNAPLDAEGNKLFEVQHTVRLSETNGQTTLNITSEVLSAGPNADQFLRGIKMGLAQALSQLESLL